MDAGLAELAGRVESGAFVAADTDEDVHGALERGLKEIVGADLGGRLRAGRSRNDQVAVDLRLYCKEAIAETLQALRALQSALLDVAESHREVVMPGYTHLPRAQPALRAHQLPA